MVAEIPAGIAAFKAAFDIASTVKGMDDAVRRNDAVMAIQERILAAQQAQAALTEEIGRLKQQIVRFEDWERKAERYQLHRWPTGTFSYASKPGVQPTEPEHHICARCYEDRQRSILNGQGRFLACPRFSAIIATAAEGNRPRRESKWL